MLPKIAIITLNWNGKEHTDECLQSLLRINYPDFEIFVVDNGSINGSVAFLKPKYPSVNFIENPRNMGFAEGNNIGIRAARAKGFHYFFLINNDAVVDADVLTSLVPSLLKNKAAIAGPKIYNYYKKSIIESAGGELSVWRSKNYQIGYKEEENGQYDEEREVSFVTGCAMLLSKEALKDNNLFDATYFAYCEDNDLCLRLVREKKKIIYVPSAKIWHKVSASTGGYKNPSAVYLFTRNRILFIKKNASLVQSTCFWAYFLTYYIPAYTIYSILTLNYRTLTSFYRGILSHVFRQLERNDFIQPYLPQNPGIIAQISQKFQLFFNKAYIPLTYLSMRIFPYNKQAAKPRKIVVLELTHIGDLIMSTPLLHELRMNYPKAKINLVCADWNNPLFQNNELVDSVLNYNSRMFSPKTKGTTFWNRLKFFYSLFRQKYDLVVDLRGDYDTLLFFLLFYRRKRIEWWGSHIMERKLKSERPRHMVDTKVEILKTLGIHAKSKKLLFAVSKNAADWAANLLKNNERPVITIAPGARWNFREWPKEKFSQLADKLMENNATVVLVGAPNEKKLAEEIAAMMKHKPIITAGTASIQQSAAIISKSVLFIGNDSGPMHVAAALSIPTVALFGPQTPVLTGPYSKNSIVIRKHVWCSPCSQTTCINQSDWCMNKITLEEVYEAAIKLWKNQN